MKLFSKLKNLFVPREEEKPGPKAAKKTKKKALKKKIKKVIKKKVKKKIVKTKKKVVKKKPKKKSVKPLKRFLEKKEIGIVTHYFGKISVGIIKLKSTLRVGEKIHIKGAHDDFSQTVKSMQINHKDVLTAGKGSEIGIKTPAPMHENDRVYKI
ncbi:MAG: hypothetical protein HQ570_04220 [Candidatus Omnitrophica bacterium]|nr:hypothetical protein [Candidatus Omnitrophota bacterium]